MLQVGQLDAEDGPRALEGIVRNSHAQIRLIDDLLGVCRVISGKTRLDVRAIDRRAVIEGALDTVRPAAAAKELRLESVFDQRARARSRAIRFACSRWCGICS